jgi:hypothetical protein
MWIGGVDNISVCCILNVIYRGPEYLRTQNLCPGQAFDFLAPN